ncbi:MAG: YaiO family outer membrane beta-barrel protein [Planctomycetes bacterium]|nr:YaiO family outer membrane beta-barrel protein [Planctomycetota bacterium]
MSRWLVAASVCLCALGFARSGVAQTDWEQEIRLARASLEKDPDAYAPGLQLARALSFTGRRTEALEVYDRLIATHPQDADSRLGRGRVYAWQGRYEEAERDLRWVTENHPQYADAWSALGDLFLWSDRPQAAVQAYSSWVTLDPKDPAARLARAKAHRSAGDDGAARADAGAAAALGAPAKDTARYFAPGTPIRPPERLPETVTWSAGAKYASREFLRSKDFGDRQDQHTYTISLQRRFDWGSATLEGIESHKFGLSDEAVALDSFVDLWDRSYGNVRVQYDPDHEVFAETDARLEIFQGFGSGWEASGNYRRLDAPDLGVDLFGVSLAKYLGNWYLRTAATFSDGGTIVNHSLQQFFRWYYLGNGDDFVELGGGWSESVEILDEAAGRKDIREGHFVGIRSEKFVTEHLGFSLSTDYSHDEHSPASWGLSLGVNYRW